MNQYTTIKYFFQQIDKIMRSFVIILSNNPKSEKFGSIAITTGIKYKWGVEKFDGIDGRIISLDNFNLTVNQQNKKCVRLFDKPGVRGCFLSHWLLWNKCVELNEPIGIFEDDVLFLKPFNNNSGFIDILKLEKLQQGKRYAAGDWWEGAHAYILTPAGAKKLINWGHINGVLPADVMLGTNILDVTFDENNLVTLNPESQVDLNTQSLTRNL